LSSTTHVCVGGCCVQMFILRKLIEKELVKNGINEDECYLCSLSSKTIVYKGQLTPKQVRMKDAGAQPILR